MTNDHRVIYLLKRLHDIRRHHLDGLLVTPRDLTQFNKSVDDLAASDDYRYKGFPDSNFVKARSPVIATAENKPEVEDSNLLSPRFALNHYFDPARPRAFKDHKGLQYGSDKALLSTAGKPKGISDPFAERLSSDRRKFQHHQLLADEEQQRYKAEKEARMKQREEEKKRDLEMLKSYDPWGKPGGGAPIGSDNRKRRFGDDNTNFSAQNTPRTDTPVYDLMEQFGKPGAGAPLRTKSGRVKTELRSDANIKFQDHNQGRGVVDMEVRYRGDPTARSEYSKELENQMATRQTRDKEARLQELRMELENLSHNPYGKPGAGAPNKSQSGRQLLTGRKITLTSDLVELRNAEKKGNQILTGRKITLTPDSFQLKKLEQRVGQRQTSGKSVDSELQEYDPWGKGVGAPVYDQFGHVRRYRASDRNYGVPTTNTNLLEDQESTSLNFDRSTGGGGAPIKTASGKVKTKMAITMRRDEKGDSHIKEESPYQYVSATAKHNRRFADDECEIYDPFGKGGGGAPVKDANGKPITSIYGKVGNRESLSAHQRKRLAARRYLDELQRGMTEQKQNREERDRVLRQGGGEFAAVIKEGRVGQPRRDPDTGLLKNQHLPASDVTKLRSNEKSYKSEESPLYHTALEQQAEERRRLHQLDRLKERQQTRQHQSKMDDFWGRPGGGAPNNREFKLKNLDDMLHSPRREAKNFYVKQHDEAAGQPRAYVRSTIPSKHTNQYEYDIPHRRQPKREYALHVPYATTGEV